MRFRIVIEIDVANETARKSVNDIASSMANLADTGFSSPVFVSTERIEANKDVLMSKENK